MYEDEKRFSWTHLFIKIIIVVIFILFTVWLLKIATKSATQGMSNSLDVLTDNIFSQNIEKMKEVGKSYFTTERLPKTVGETKKLSLARMYDEDLILEIKDKNGNACSAKNSYVTVEKMENEYQMKVYLECGEEKQFIRVIMGCYNYCDTDICEKKKDVNRSLEYEYSRTSGGSWTDWSNWSNWSTNSVSKTDSRDVETKVVRENYTYDKTNTNSVLAGNATCPTLDGYTLTANNNGVCSYTKIVTRTTNPVSCASTYNGYNLVSQNGFTCNYSKGTTSTVSPVSCASTYNGYNLVSQNGFTCNYSKSTTETTNPVGCASSYSGYSLVSQNGFTCNYRKNTVSTISATSSTSGGDAIYGENCYTYRVAVGTKIVSACTGCAKQVQTVYENRRHCDTVVTGYTPVVTTYSCPSGYTRSNTTCSKSGSATTTTTVGCPSGYSASGSTCVRYGTATTTTTVGCPSGYSASGSTCVKSGTATTATTVGCPNGYTKKNNACVKDTTSTKTQNAVCPANQTLKDGKCYKNVTTTEKVTGVRDVTYYRYRTRSYTGGSVDYKWSASDRDTNLTNAGYRLTGKTRNNGGK